MCRPLPRLILAPSAAASRAAPGGLGPLRAFGWRRLRLTQCPTQNQPGAPASSPLPVAARSARGTFPGSARQPRIKFVTNEKPQEPCPPAAARCRVFCMVSAEYLNGLFSGRFASNLNRKNPCTCVRFISSFILDAWPAQSGIALNFLQVARVERANITR